MGRSINENIKNRFGDRISVSYPNRQLDPSEQRIQNENLVKAFSQVLAGVLKREPTPDELLGVNEIKLPRKKSSRA